MEYKLPPDATPEEWKNAAWKVWKCAREHNHTIPSHWLDAMREIAIAAIEAQASVQQEPYAWVYWHPSNDTFDGPDTIRKKSVARFTDDTRLAMQRDGWEFEPLYTHPAQQAKPQPLSDEQMWKLWNAQGSDDMNQHEAIAFARAIEAAHGIQGS